MDIIFVKLRKLTLEFNVLKLFLKNFLPALIILIISFLLLNIYIFYYLTNNEKYINFINTKKDNIQEDLSF